MLMTKLAVSIEIQFHALSKSIFLFHVNSFEHVQSSAVQISATSSSHQR